MFCRSYQRGVRVGPIVAAALLVSIVVSMCTVPTRAAITDTDWSLKISEREMAFRPASDMMAMKSLMWDLPYSRMFARNMPFICLTNESDTASITEFKMTIGDEQFQFANTLMGMYAKLGKESPTSPSMSSTVADGGDTLVVNFLNGGLAPGATVQFQFDIDVDAALAGSFYQHPDYRTVLFDMNGDNLYNLAGIDHDVDDSDNSQVTLKFEQSGQSPVTVGPVNFEDPSVVDGSAGFVNNRLARYGQNDPIRAFGLEGGGVVPEPDCVALALVGLLGMLLPWSRSRRRG
jgi:hypothetical protein